MNAKLAAWQHAMGFKLQRDAAQALGVSLRTYARWYAADQLPPLVEAACAMLLLRKRWPELAAALDELHTLIHSAGSSTGP